MSTPHITTARLVNLTIKADDYSASTTVSGTLPDGGDTLSLTVTAPGVRFGEQRLSTVNWSALGSQTPDDAAAYAELIMVAVAVAREYNAKAGLS